jgi:cell wall-associated NlpC family hydrolase
MPLTEQQRQAIVAEAKTWLGTPYRGWSCAKGAGTDCGQFLYGLFRNTGHLPVLDLPTDYNLQVAQHAASTEYIDIVADHMREIPEHEAQAGDVVVYKLGLAYAHAALILEWPGLLIHCMSHGGVKYTSGRTPPSFRRAQRKFFTLKESVS